MCDRGCNCLVAIIIAIFLGIILGALAFTGTLTSIATLGWIAFGIAGVSLILLTLIAAFSGNRAGRCVCCYGKCLLAGIIGTLIAVFAGIAFTLTGIALAIVVGIGAIFAIFLLLSIIQFVICLIDNTCRCRE